MVELGWPAYLAWREQYATILDPSRYPIAWLDAQVFAGFIAAWATAGAGILAKLDTYPTGLTEVHFMAAAGDLPACIELSRDVEAWGRSLGCAASVIESRPGWVKAMKPEGYSTHQVCLRKDL